MRFETRNLPPRVLAAANLPVLENIILRFQSEDHNGQVVLCESPVSAHFHLEYLPPGQDSPILARSTFLHEDLLIHPGSIARLVHEAADFIHVVLRKRDAGFVDETPDEFISE